MVCSNRMDMEVSNIRKPRTGYSGVRLPYYCFYSVMFTAKSFRTFKKFVEYLGLKIFGTRSQQPLCISQKRFSLSGDEGL